MAEHDNEWNTYFDHHAPQYDEEPFTRATGDEVEFLLRELSPAPGSLILDVGCGTGRHALSLAREGYRVIGFDLSRGMLQQAQLNAERTGLAVTWVQGDASTLPFTQFADAVVCLCEGGFGLLGSKDNPLFHEMSILKGMFLALKPGGKLILTAPNGLAKIRDATPEMIQEGLFDPLSLTEVFPLEYEQDGHTRQLIVRERGFVPSELHLMLTWAGFAVSGIYGGTAGAWQLEAPALDEMEIMALASKPLQ